MIPAPSLLLDTHIWVWIISRTLERLSDEALAAVESAAARNSLRVSSISAWEVGILFRKRRLASTMQPTSWLQAALAAPGLHEVGLDSATAIASTMLPGDPPPDPADRFLIATSHTRGWTLVTSDDKIVRYALGEGIAVLDARP